MALFDNVLGFVMAGGRGTRLKVLTRDTSKPMVDILGHHRIFDFVAANIVNTGIPVTLVAMQREQAPLAEYISTGGRWGFDGIHRKLEIVRPDSAGDLTRFRGTADSVRKSVAKIDKYAPEIVLVLGADHVYNMDYVGFIAEHSRNNADITIMTNAVPKSKVKDLGIVKIDESGRIIDFAEKPTDENVIESFRLAPGTKRRLGIRDPGLNFLASMGNYAFFWDRLKRSLGLSGVDFGRDIIPAIKEGGGVLRAYVFDGYWRDVGKVQDYFDCNMDFTNRSSLFDLLERSICTDGSSCKPIPADSSIHHTILNSCDTVHQQSVITDSVLGHQVVVEEKCVLDHCVLLGAERNGWHGDHAIEQEHTTRIGERSKLSYVILDENVRVGNA
jgi:glucose-1-phosphate adenylyltransferase